MKKLFALLFTLALLILCSAALAEIVIDGTFPDENFKAYIREAIDKDGSGTLNNREIYETLKIDCSGCEIKNLEGINLFADLEELVCDSNPITKLDLSGNSRLKEVSARDCGITSVTVGSLPELKRLDLHTNGLTKINLSKTPKLEELNIYGNAVKELNLAALPNLKSLDCSMNALASLDLTANKKLVTLECTNNKLTSLDVSKNTALETLICYRNKLTSLTLGSLKKLHHLECGNNSFTKLDISKCTLLDAMIAAGGERQANDCFRWGRGEQFIEIDNKVAVTYSGGKFNNRVTKITLNKTESTLTRKAENLTPSVKLKATVEPADASNREVTWTSSDPSIAEVDVAGKVTGLKNGTVTVTCTAQDGSGKKATCKVTVKSIKVSEITLNKTSSTLTRKAENLTPSVQLKAVTILPENAAYPKVKWTSDNPEVAEVDGTGKVTGLKNGTAIITCKASDGGGAKATCKVTIKSIKVSAINLNKSGVTLTRTADDLKPTVQLAVASVLPENAAYQKVKWTSDKPEVATVDAKTGLVTGLKYGTAIITCKASDGGGASATCKISVSNRRVSEITLNESSVTLTRTSEKPKPTVQLSVASILPADAASKNVKWSSDKPDIAKVDANGKVTALKAGSAVITCKSADGGASATCKITVKYRKVTGITLNKTSASVKVSKTLQLKVTEITPADAMVKDVTWESSNTKVATVDKNGKVTAVKAGTAVITCTSRDGGKFKVTCKITVK